MSSFFHAGIGSLSIDEDGKGSTSDVEQLQCVNPQYTDKRYHRPGESQSSIVSNGFMTPCPPRINSNSRHPSLMLSDTTASCVEGPASASPSSSFNSSPGYGSSSSSSVSTAASSRRQSIINPNSNQYYLSDSSPTPAFRRKIPKESLSINQYPLQEPLSVNSQGACSNAAPFSIASDVAHCSDPNEYFSHYTERGQNGWQEYEYSLGALSAYELSGPKNESACLSVDLASNYGRFLSTRIEDCSETDFESHETTLFRNVIEPQAVIHSQTTLNPIALGQPFQFSQRQIKDDASASDDDEYLVKSTAVACNDLKSCVQKGKPPRKQGNRRRDPPSIADGKGKRRNQCPHCFYACNRPEHLTRHVNAKHNHSPKEYPCEFPDCIDKKTGERRVIMARGDNHKAHYAKTHFTYGSTEKSGKNRRKSMKVSIEKGLRDKDYRWSRMLAGEMTMEHDAKGAWKMLGYSIRETSELKVKDIAPEWQGPDETTLEAFDVRWKALKDGTMTYEQAMSVGTDMAETPEQGLLGVTMAETEEMGIKRLDPRWNLLESEGMSIEDSEKLGVKDRNPTWIASQAQPWHDLI